MTPKEIFDLQDRALSKVTELRHRLQQTSKALLGASLPDAPKDTAADYPDGILPRIFTVGNEIDDTLNRCSDLLRHMEETLGLIDRPAPTIPASERPANQAFDSRRLNIREPQYEAPKRASPLRMAMAKVDEIEDALEKNLTEALEKDSV